MSWPGTVGRKYGIGFTLIELLVVVSIIAVLVAIALPNYIKVKDKAKEAETKANLHNIQLSLERFATDHEGTYPQYLIGGDNTYMDIELGHDHQVDQQVIEVPAEQCSDELLRGGYLSSYPRNPFVKQQESVQLFQAQVGDPLRNSYVSGHELGTRFGAYGNVMGQTLCDARWLSWTYNDLETGKSSDRNTWSNIDYEAYDVWNGNQHHAYLPGEFMYKSIGEIIPRGTNKHTEDELAHLGNDLVTNDENHPGDATIPLTISSYMLSAWGGARTKGQDVLGEEPLVIVAYARPGSGDLPYASIPYIPVLTGMLPGSPVMPETVNHSVDVYGIPAWTRGVNRSHIGPLWGSPYGPSRNQGEQLSAGNANGFKDGLILVLSPGEDDNADR